MSKFAATLLCSLSLPLLSSWAQSYAWGGTGTLWGLASNWDPAGIPGAADYVSIARGNGNPSSPNIEIDLGSGARVFSILFGGSSGTGFYTLGSGGPGAQTLTLSSGATIFGEALTVPGRSVPTINANIVLEGGVNWFPRNDFKIGGGISGAIGSGDNMMKLALNHAHMHFYGVISDGEGLSLGVQIGGDKTASSAVYYAPNTYTGSTIVASNLVMAAGNVIPDASDIILSGKIVSGGFDDLAGALQITSDAAILDFGNGQSDLAFADSSGLAWSGVLTLMNFNIGVDTLRFGNNEFALTSDQLGTISLSGYAASLDQDGYVLFSPVPEPGTMILVACGLLVHTARRLRSAFNNTEI